MSISEHIYEGILPNTLTTLYTMPLVSPARVSVRYITVVNNNESSVLRWYLYLVRSGDTASKANRLIPGTKRYEVKKGGGMDYNTWKVLHPGTTIQAYCDGDATIFIDGAKES